MPDEIKPVQPEVASQGATPTAAPAPVPEPAKQPSQEEIFSKLLDSKLPEYFNKMVEPLKREFQSTKDKSIAEVERARRQAEETLRSIQYVAGDDPDPQTRVRIAELQAQARVAQRQQYEDQVQRNGEQFLQKYQEKVKKILKRFDVDPDDKRMNWHENETDQLERLDKITESAETIYRANKKDSEDRYSSLDKRIKEMEGKSKKENIEANSVDTSSSSGTQSEKSIRDAYIKNPYDPDNSRKYMEMRSKRKR
jgi:hypothetical protein